MRFPLKSRIEFPNDAGSPLGRVSLAGFLQNHTGSGPALRILGSYAVVYLVRGPGRYRDARGTRRELVTGDLLLVLPDVPHQYGPPPGQTWDEFYVVFSGPVFDLWRKKQLLGATTLVRQLAPVDYWLQRLDDAVEHGTDSLQRVCALQHVLADAFSQPAANEPAFLAQAKALLEAEPVTSLADIARQVGLSYESFRKQFTHLTGLPPAQYRATRVILNACRLLTAGEPSLKEIAAQLGFCDEFHFSKRFKQITGLTPTQYRQLLPGQRGD